MAHLTVRAAAPDALQFNVTATESSVLVSGSTGSRLTEQGVTFERSTDALVDNQFAVSVEHVAGDAEMTHAAALRLHGAAAHLDGNLVVRDTDGEVTCVAVTPYVRKSLTLQMARTGGTVHDTFVEYQAGTLARASYDAVVARMLEGKQSAIYTLQDHTAPAYTRNDECWAAGLDMTALSPWNSTGAATRAGTAVSPRHIVFAKHYQIDTGATIRFVANDGTVVTRTVTAKASVAAADIAVGLLDSDLPVSITPMKVVPVNFEDYFPDERFGLPVFVTDKEEKAILRKFNLYGLDGLLAGVPYDEAPFAVHSEDIVGGDSGNPWCLIVGGELILLSTHYTTYTGPPYHMHITAINNVMTSLGGGYQLTEADLTAFTSFGA